MAVSQNPTDPLAQPGNARVAFDARQSLTSPRPPVADLPPARSSEPAEKDEPEKPQDFWAMIVGAILAAFGAKTEEEKPKAPKANKGAPGTYTVRFTAPREAVPYVSDKSTVTPSTPSLGVSVGQEGVAIVKGRYLSPGEKELFDEIQGNKNKKEVFDILKQSVLDSDPNMRKPEMQTAVNRAALKMFAELSNPTENRPEYVMSPAEAEAAVRDGLDAQIKAAQKLSAADPRNDKLRYQYEKLSMLQARLQNARTHGLPEDAIPALQDQAARGNEAALLALREHDARRTDILTRGAEILNDPRYEQLKGENAWIQKWKDYGQVLRANAEATAKAMVQTSTHLGQTVHTYTLPAGAKDITIENGYLTVTPPQGVTKELYGPTISLKLPKDGKVVVDCKHVAVEKPTINVRRSPGMPNVSLANCKDEITINFTCDARQHARFNILPGADKDGYAAQALSDANRNFDRADASRRYREYQQHAMKDAQAAAYHAKRDVEISRMQLRAESHRRYAATLYSRAAGMHQGANAQYGKLGIPVYDPTSGPAPYTPGGGNQPGRSQQLAP